MSQYLLFYDKNGYDYNMSLTNGIWQGSIYFPRISKDLFEINSIFILELMENTILSEDVIAKPKYYPSEVFIRARIDLENDIYLYNKLVDDVDPEIKTLEKTTEIILELNGSADSIDTEDKKQDTEFDFNPLKINVAFNPKSEDTFSNKLFIDYVDSNNDVVDNIAEIELYGESISEDHRFPMLLGNLGMNVPQNKFYIFKNTDVNEPLPDWKIINPKRKEMLLEGHNIHPFIGSYKGLINVIKYFGYNELTVREYWKNVDPSSKKFNTYTQTDVIDTFDTKLDFNKSTTDLLPNSKYKKTSLFSLNYKLNKTIEDEFDVITDLPEVEDVFDFSNDEILIKLQGLRKELKETYLPFNARIIDIVGEGTYYTKKDININTSTIKIDDIDVGITPEIKIQTNDDKNYFEISVSDETYDDINKPIIGYLEDLRPLLYSLDLTTSRDLDFSSTTQSVGDIIDHFVGYFERYAFINFSQLPDSENTEIGCPIVLTNTSFELTWDEAETRYNELTVQTGSTLYTWDTIGSRGYYNVEWIIEKRITDDSPQEYLYTISGDATELKSIPVILPYRGLYTVSIKIQDVYNHKSTIIKTDAINVQPFEVQFSGFYRSLEGELTWQQNILWDNYDTYWDLPTRNSTSIDEATISYETINRANYILANNRLRLEPNPFEWDKVFATWDNLSNAWWDLWRWGSDNPGRFNITDVSNGGTITIDGDTHTFTTTTSSTDWLNAAQELNQSTLPGIKRFVYNPVQDGDGGPYVELFAVANYYNNEPIDIIYDNGANGDTLVESVTINGSWNDVKVINDRTVIKPFTEVVFTYTKCKINGKRKPTWTLLNNNTGETWTSNKEWFDHIFKSKGEYTLTLELYDINENKFTGTRYGIISVQ